MSRTLLIAGATGKQGGATIQALLSSDFEILALTRDASSPSAQKLAALSPRVKLVQGDLNNARAIFDMARLITKNSIWGVFSVQAANSRNPSIEEAQGKSLIDAAVCNNVQVFVYTSIDRGGALSLSTPTNVPVWTTKHRIEQHLRAKAKTSGMRYTILRPTNFMELLSDDMSGRIFANIWKNHFTNERLHLVAVRDIGYFAAQAFIYSDQFSGREITLTGDEITFAEANAIFHEKFGKSLPTANNLLVLTVLRLSKNIKPMIEFVKTRPPDLGIEACRMMHPGLTDWRTWLLEESAFGKGAK
jgi:uncharacterized protein YbjT (DUF2867 family)